MKYKIRYTFMALLFCGILGWDLVYEYQKPEPVIAAATVTHPVVHTIKHLMAPADTGSATVATSTGVGTATTSTPTLQATSTTATSSTPGRGGPQATSTSSNPNRGKRPPVQLPTPNVRL
jgi:hypothetical protein